MCVLAFSLLVCSGCCSRDLRHGLGSDWEPGVWHHRAESRGSAVLDPADCVGGEWP